MTSIGKNFNPYSTFKKQVNKQQILKDDFSSEKTGWQAVIKEGDTLDGKKVRDAFEAGNRFLVIFEDGTQRNFPIHRLAK